MSTSFKAYKDKSIRDWSVIGKIKNPRQAILVTRLGRNKVCEMKVEKYDWYNSPGDTIGNKDYDRRQMIRLKLKEIGFDFEANNENIAERLADSHMYVLKQIWNCT